MWRNRSSASTSVSRCSSARCSLAATAAAGRRRTRSSPAARPAPRGSRCARSRRPWCRSRWPGDRAATRRASPGHRDAQHLRRDRRHDLGREAERAGIERGIADRRRAERVEVRGEVAVHPERLHQRHRGGHVVQHLRARPGPAASSRWAAGAAFTSSVALGGELQALRDQLVEPLVALEQAVHGRQERPRLRALDDAVVVGAGDGHDLADAELAEPLLGHRRRTPPGSRSRRPR